jgi:hypothetical protein
MEEFEGGGELPGIFLDWPEELVAHQTKDRTDPFPSQAEKIVGGIV